MPIKSRIGKASRPSSSARNRKLARERSALDEHAAKILEGEHPKHAVIPSALCPLCPSPTARKDLRR